MDVSKAVPIEMPVGAGVFFPGTTWHYSAPNASGERRLGIVSVYVADEDFQRAAREAGDDPDEALWALRGNARPA